MKNISPLAANFTFWQPPTGHTVETGAESLAFELPSIPLPLLNVMRGEDTPSDDTIGSSLYDYLRQFPACPFGKEYAELLRDAWPHYIADLAAMILMLDHKEVDAPYVRRKISGLQILLLLEPNNSGLQQQLGVAFYDLALSYVELCNCRTYLAKAMNYFSDAERSVPNDLTNLNYMAQIDYLIGDYPKASERWETLASLVPDTETKAALAGRIEKLKNQGYPEKPLLVDLESIGNAMRLLADGSADVARDILEVIEQEQVVPTEFPNPEFYSLLAISRERSGDLSGAQVAFSKALELDPTQQESHSGIDRLTQRGK